MQRRHGAGRDRALEARAHDELGAGAERLDERPDLAEIVGAVGVAHDDEAAADERDRVDVGAAEAAPRHLEHAGAARLGDLGGAVGRAVDDQDLDPRAARRDALPAPVDEAADGDLLVERRDQDGDLGIGHVVRRGEEADVVGAVGHGAAVVGRKADRGALGQLAVLG